MSDLNEKDEVTIKILDTAQTLFQEYGIEDVSMHQIAQSSGIGQGTLYRRFPSKNMLCLSLMKNKFERFMRDTEAYLREARDVPVVQKLTTVVTRLVLLAGEDLEWMKQIMRTDRLRDTKVNCFELPPFVFIRNHVEHLLKEAEAAHKLKPVDPFFTASMIATSLTPEMITYLNDQGYSMEEIAERYCQSFIHPLFK
ncbi:TetR/AcrR family transcriptional regulator [Xylanibacillus composti]|uniref:HTH tetR-type domain-containing protein n=1 Tax=Xylanibacillus composti TaxID=1572762 RepID=A0A8J4H626_9BACL|nr:TetR/AcrR family transcriptional regulator [Xylanibacillus composti]MDT9726370.1 TetR/AcrR family transcriptional regulator [Xylanibacillus composti]GIQ70391.1 hypothetical protein XYCOK13_32150 [Xylanibacillus composti]